MSNKINFCRKCGRHIAEGEKFCRNCGYNLGVAQKPQVPQVPQVPRSRQRRSKKPLVITITSVVLVASLAITGF